jgi:hypothetical protein
MDMTLAQLRSCIEQNVTVGQAVCFIVIAVLILWFLSGGTSDAKGSGVGKILNTFRPRPPWPFFSHAAKTDNRHL